MEKQSAPHTNSRGFYRAEPFVSAGNWRQVLIPEGTALPRTGNLGSRNTRGLYYLYYQDSCKVLPQAQSRPAREKLGSGDDSASHTQG